MPHDVRVGRIYEPAAVADGSRVLVDRVWPRGVSKASANLDLWAKGVAPSTELRVWYGHEPAKFHEFGARYRNELAQPDRAAALGELGELLRRGPVILLTATRDMEHTHALVLAEVLRAAKRRSPEEPRSCRSAEESRSCRSAEGRGPAQVWRSGGRGTIRAMTMAPPATELVTLAEIEAARSVLAGVIRTTPLEPSRAADRGPGPPGVAEVRKHPARRVVQDPRGLSADVPAERRGTSRAAWSRPAPATTPRVSRSRPSLLGIDATVFMPVGAPLPKVAATKGYGADIELSGNTVDEALVAAQSSPSARGPSSSTRSTTGTSSPARARSGWRSSSSART